MVQFCSNIHASHRPTSTNVLSFLIYISVRAEKPNSHKYDDPNGSKDLIAFIVKSGYRFLSKNQNSANSFSANKVFKTRSFLNSMRFSSSFKVRNSLLKHMNGFITHSYCEESSKGKYLEKDNEILCNHTLELIQDSKIYFGNVHLYYISSISDRRPLIKS